MSGAVPPEPDGESLPPDAQGAMYVRLTKKLAEVVNGIDISDCAEGDVIELAEADAQMLITEGWADAVPNDAVPPFWRVLKPMREVAADRGYQLPPKKLR